MNQLSKEKLALLAIHHPLVGTKTLKRLRKRLKSYEYVPLVSAATLIRLGLTPRQADAIQESKKLIKRSLSLIDEKNIKILLPEEKDYPKLLRVQNDHPAVLYVRGSIPPEPRMSIVGSRRYTDYGKVMAKEVGEVCAQYGICVVSGLALGIDGFAQRACVEAGGKSVGVLGSGVDRIYPASNQGLAQLIIENDGAIISEYSLSTPSYPGNFPQRNRIIAALANATLVVEGSIESGSLITAKQALEYGRDVWAVPANLHREASAGPLDLLRNGAQPYYEPSNLASYFGVEIRETAPTQKIDEADRVIINQFSRAGTHLDEVAEALQLDIAELSSKVIVLELKGLVRHEGAGIYRRIV